MENESDHPLDVMTRAFEIDADDPSGWEPEMHVEHRYGKLFYCEERAEYEDIEGIEGSFYHIEPNDLHVLVEIGPSDNESDLLCLSFSIYTKFVYHSDDALCTAITEVSVELLNGESECIHEFEFCESQEWDHWPEPDTLKYWIIDKCNTFLRGFQGVMVLTIDDIDNSLPMVPYIEQAAQIQETAALGLYSPATLMTSNTSELWQSDVDRLDDNQNHAVRINYAEDAEVKRLYHIYKSL